MKIARKILFYLFVLAYIITCPMIIMFILGQVINPDTNKVIGTGLIHISSLPPSASVYINNKLYSDTTPTTIRDLPKGNYEIKLLNENYQPYKKTVVVKEGNAITLDNILLAPKDWKKKPLSNMEFKDLFLLEDTPFILARKGPLMKDILYLKLYDGFHQTLHTESILPTKEASPVPILNNDSIYSKAKILKIFTVKGSTSLIFEIRLDKQTSFLWTDIKEKTPPVIDISALFPKKPQQILWDPDDDQKIFSLQHNYINHINITNKALYPKIIKNVHSYAVYDKTIYTMLLDSTFKKWDYKGKSQEMSLPIFSSLPIIKKTDDIFISVHKKNILLFFVQRGKLLSNQEPSEIMEKNIKGFNWDNRYRKLLAWTKDKIGSLELTPIDPEVSLKTPTSSLQWIASGKKNIDQAFWAYKGSHILYTDSDKVYITETTDYGTPVETEITDIEKNTKIYYSEDTGKLYYIESKTSKFMSIEVPPSQSIAMQSFTDKVDKLEGKKVR